MLEPNKLYNMDCVKGMEGFPDGYFDLAIVDPPYFSGPERRGFYGRKTSPIGVRRTYRKSEAWELPGPEYFKELLRVSKNQIIWGINHFRHAPYLGSGAIVWDKCNGGSSFSDCEIAHCSLHGSARLFRYMWNGMMQGKSLTEGWTQQGDKSRNEKRIHPTQKPVALYKWLLMEYAKPGDKILDTHVGSGSSLVACEDMGFEYVGFEIDPHYCGLARERLEEERAQMRMEMRTE